MIFLFRIAQVLQKPKVKSKKGLEMRRNGWRLKGLSGRASHACPASGDSIQACRPSSDKARS